MFRPISRRTLLRGAGAAMALPWLETMGRAADNGGPANLTEPPLRMAFLFLPNGTRPDHWTPPGDGDDLELMPHLKSFEGLKSDILLLENLWNKNTVGRNGHWPKVPAWLSGGYVERTTGDDLDAGGITIDQFAASKIGDRTPLADLRTWPRTAPQRHRRRRRWLRQTVRLLPFLARSAHARAQRDRAATRL